MDIPFGVGVPPLTPTGSGQTEPGLSRRVQAVGKTHCFSAMLRFVHMTYLNLRMGACLSFGIFSFSAAAAAADELRRHVNANRQREERRWRDLSEVMGPAALGVSPEPPQARQLPLFARSCPTCSGT